ncbi:hypothetical protein ACQ4PT_036880 [Festuca glaucescens]
MYKSAPRPFFLVQHNSTRFHPDMEAKVVSIAFVLLLLTFEEDDFGVSAYPAKWNPTISQEDDFGVSAYPAKWNPSTSQEDDFGVSAYPAKWNPSTSHEDDFDVSAYPAKWIPSTSEEDDFGVSAYPAKWNPSTSQEDDFGVSAYPAKWNPSTSQEGDFGVSAYPAKWNPSTSQEDDFCVSAYPAKWNPSISQEDDFGVSAYLAKWNPSTSQEDDFGVSAYPAKWNPSTLHEDDFDVSAYPAKWIPSTSEEDDFGVSAYPAKWNPSTSQEDDFGVSAYPAKWNPSTSQEGNFGVSAYPAKWNPSTSRLFCHHVIAVFEHLRLDEIPSKYILQRYTKDAVTNPDFNRRDYMTTTEDGTSIEYRRTILYSEAVKIINKGCSSEAKFQIALSAFRGANSRLDNEDAELENNEDAEMENNEQSSNQDNTTRETGSQNDIPQAENNDPYANIQPPLVAITKGSKTTDAARKNGKCKPLVPARPEPELDEYGRPKGTRICGTCNKIDGHNSRTCKARQLAKKLLETHEKVYGPTASSGNIKVRIRNLLARQHIPETDDEEKLDTDEGECFEDETDDEEYEQEDEDEDITEQEETQNTPDVDDKLENLNKKGGQRKCSVCNLRLGHYASTCANKEKILQQQIIERQTSDGAIVKPKGVKACGTCNKIRGHNSRTCERRQLEEQLLHLQSTENDSNTMEDRSKEKKNRKKTQTTPAAIRRSTRKR